MDTFSLEEMSHLRLSGITVLSGKNFGGEREAAGF
jgi:hypothetical protein